MSDTPEPVPDPLRTAALAADLDAADLRSEPLRRLWGEEADDALGRGMREPILRAIEGDSGLSPLSAACWCWGCRNRRPRWPRRCHSSEWRGSWLSDSPGPRARR
ncbi:hypothetical protein [Microbacterium sp. Se63.02b]|uniref:DUF7059 domain-containing protein n=1 Tax=Microbacterium sp. Se63.02b TaxID=2709304 RepID=UPI0031F696CC